MDQLLRSGCQWGGKGWDFVNFLICGGLNVVLGGGVKELPSSMWDSSAALSMGTLPLNELVVSAPM